jgi:hypothetical protein
MELELGAALVVIAGLGATTAGVASASILSCLAFLCAIWALVTGIQRFTHA